MPHPLDNIIWESLVGPHASLAQGNALALRYPPAFAPFHAVAFPTPEHFGALAKLVGLEERVVMFTPEDIDPGRDLEVSIRAPILQMIRTRSAVGAPAPHVMPLTDGDSADMRALAEETKPGPFSERTRELGNFFGIRVDGKLVAMAGERMRPAGYTEVSAVCTLREFRGRHYGEQLVDAVTAGIVARGETPLLHVFSDNFRAIGLYGKLGFEVRQEMRVTVLKKKAGRAE